jgi:pimeloyl-ACP methyl ester carboxylesterase
MSMGGMIAQTVAARYPNRVRTLTSIFSSTGDRRVGQPARSTLLRLARPLARTAEQYVEDHLTMLGHIASATYPYDADRERAWAAGAWDRGPGRTAHHGIARQISAIQKSGDRTTELHHITAPTLVAHGDTDRMVHPSGGSATAAAIPGARLVTVNGLAHHLPPQLDQRIVELVSTHADAARSHSRASVTPSAARPVSHSVDTSRGGLS